MIDPRKPIPNGEWIVTIQLEVDGQPMGDPLTLRYADSYCAGTAKSANGKDAKASSSMPENVGYLIARAIYERALQLKPGRKRK